MNNYNYAIEINNVTMQFNLAREKVTSLKEHFINKINKKNNYNEFIALENISFNIDKGESFAIVGSNGSGKSTLLKIISGIYKATNGSVKIDGSIAPLIELGAGFDLELTARENVFLNGAVLGYSKKFMLECFDEIVDFAELWEFIDVPVKNFSSGMQARLGFSIATIVKPDILIVDEILSVGDASFRKKCDFKMHNLINSGATLILVSHDVEEVKRLCNRAVWIDRGRIKNIGNAEEICLEYVGE